MWLYFANDNNYPCPFVYIARNSLIEHEWGQVTSLVAMDGCSLKTIYTGRRKISIIVVVEKILLYLMSVPRQMG